MEINKKKSYFLKIRVNKANIYMYLKFYTKYLSTTKFMSAGDRWLEKFLETNLDVNKMKKMNVQIYV